MKRIAITVVAVVVLAAVSYAGQGAGAQDGVNPTVSALRTEVAGLEATVQARGEKIDLQRTRIAELRDEATPTTPAFELEGVHDAKIYDRFAAGRYTVAADCEVETMQVYVLDAAHGILAQPVSRTALGEAGALRVDITSEGEYKVEIYCAGRWRVALTQGSP